MEAYLRLATRGTRQRGGQPWGPQVGPRVIRHLVGKRGWTENSSIILNICILRNCASVYECECDTNIMLWAAFPQGDEPCFTTSVATPQVTQTVTKAAGEQKAWTAQDTLFRFMFLMLDVCASMFFGQDIHTSLWMPLPIKVNQKMKTYIFWVYNGCTMLPDNT